MALKTRVWGAGRLLLIGSALLVTYVVFAAASMRIALRTREVVVPSLTGKALNEATAVLADAGLNLKVEEARRVDPEGGGSPPRRSQNPCRPDHLAGSPGWREYPPRA